MLRIITMLLLTSVFVITVHSENVLKCYMCTSLSDEGCDSNWNLTTKLQPVECTGTKIADWQRRIQQHETLSSVARLFEDEILQHYQGAPPDMACAKMILNIKQEVVVRMCQTAKMEHIDPCKTMEDKLNGHDFKMKQCALCLKDACNSTIFLSSEIFCISLSFFCTLIALYLWAL